MAAALTRVQIGEFFRRLREANPEPKGELHYINAFTLVVAGRSVCCFRRASIVRLLFSTHHLFFMH